MNMKDWVDLWKTNAPILESQRMKELQNLDTLSALADLAPAFEHALLKGEIRPSSGLIELQRYFLKSFAINSK